MKLSHKVLGLSLAALVGITSSTFADDGGKGSGRKSLESRIAELEAKLKDAGAGGVKGSGIKVNGYVDTSYIVNLSDRSNSGAASGGVAGAAALNTGRVFDNQFDSFVLDAAKVTIEKDKDSSKFPAGFRVDLVYGADASVINGGINTTTGAAAPTYNDNDFAVEQAYVNFGVPVGNGIDVKVGKMVTLVGYEVIESPANWQFSRSDAFRLAPMTQLGVTLGYKWTDWLTSTVGVVNGYDSSGALAGSTVIGAGNRNTDLSFVGRLDSTLPKNSLGEFNAFVAAIAGNDSATPATVTGTAGSSPTVSGLASYIFNAGLGWNKPFGIKPLGLGFDYLYRNDDIRTSAAAANVQFARGVIDANAFSFYHKWDWSKWTTTSGRFSYTSYGNNVTTANGPAGNAPVTATASLAAVAIPAAGSGAASFLPPSLDVYSYTLTQAFNVWKDTLVRLEWRHDWIDHDAIGFGTAGGGTAGRDDIRQEQDTIAVNVVYSF